MLLTRPPLIHFPKETSSLDLHVLGTPPAFVLSQDQTLNKKFNLCSYSYKRIAGLLNCLLYSVQFSKTIFFFITFVITLSPSSDSFSISSLILLVNNFLKIFFKILIENYLKVISALATCFILTHIYYYNYS